MNRIKELQRLLGVYEDGIIGRDTLRVFCQAFNVTPVQAVLFFANVDHETGGFVRSEENLNYTSSARIRQVWPSRFKTDASAQPYVRNPQGLANFVYGGRMGNNTFGDGWKFRGRGPLQTTGKDNYEQLGAFVGEDLLTNPDLVKAKYYWQSALFYFYRNKVWDYGKDLSEKSIESVRRKVNGGIIGLGDVKKLIDSYKKFVY